MSGKRRILLVTEDPLSFSNELKDAERQSAIAYLSLLHLVCETISKYYKNCTVENVYYAVVYPKKSPEISWLPVSDMEQISNTNDRCKRKLENSKGTDEPEARQFIQKGVYDKINILKNSVGSSDVVDLIWIVPNLEKISPPLAVHADSKMASFLFQAFVAFQSATDSCRMTLLSTNSSNDILIWAKLLNCDVFWVADTELNFPPFSSEPIESPNDSYILPPNRDSLIIEDRGDEILKSLQEKIDKNGSYLPSVDYHRVWQISSEEMNIVCNRLICSTIRQRCNIEWTEDSNGFTKQLSFNETPISGVLHRCSVDVINVDQPKEFDVILNGNKPIRLLNRFSPMEIIEFLYIFRESSMHLILSLPHPYKNAMKSLLPSDMASDKMSLFGCSVMTLLMERNSSDSLSLIPNLVQTVIRTQRKPKSLFGLMMLTATSCDLIISTANCGSFSILTDIMKTSFSHAEYPLIMESDISQSIRNLRLPSRNDTNKDYLVVDVSREENSVSRDLTRMNRWREEVEARHGDKRGKSRWEPQGEWEEEDVLKRTSDLTIRESDQWKAKLFQSGSTTVRKSSRSTRRQKEPRRTQILSSIHDVARRQTRQPRDVGDLVRVFLSSGEPAADMQLFEYRPLSLSAADSNYIPIFEESDYITCDELADIPAEEKIGSLYFGCMGEDYWDAHGDADETKRLNMCSDVDCYGSMLVMSGSSKAYQGLKTKSGNSILETNYSKIEKCINSEINQLLPVSYRDTDIQTKVFELTTHLCQVILGTLYDMNRIVLPSSTVAKEVKVQTKHVFYSLIPSLANTQNDQLSTITRRRSRYSDISSLIDGSPYSNRDLGATPDTSLLGTPSSIGNIVGHDCKRFRPIPPLPDINGSSFSENMPFFE